MINSNDETYLKKNDFCLTSRFSTPNEFTYHQMSNTCSALKTIFLNNTYTTFEAFSLISNGCSW